MTQLLPLNAIENPPSLRNYIINGCCRVAQRASSAITNNAYTFGGADRILAYPNSFTTASGTVAQTSGNGTANGYAQQVTLTTTGTGSMIFATRLEARDVARLNGKTLTISAKVYHDTGAGVATAVQLYKANTADTFSGVTQIGTTVSTGTVSTATWTKISATFTLGATDASNGLMVFVQFQNLGAVTAKNFAIGEWQLEQGSVGSEFEMRPFGYEVDQCLRYYETGTGSVTAYNAGAGSNIAASGVSFMAVKRAVPTVAFSSITYGNASALATRGTISQTFAPTSVSVTAAGSCSADFTYTASAEL